MTPRYVRLAVDDIAGGLKNASLAGFLAWEDIRQRYVRTMLGPWWIVLSTGVWLTAMGFVMTNLFGQSYSDYLPYVFSGLLIWGLISSSIYDSSHVLLQASGLITSFSIPIFTHYIRFILRNHIIFLHNIAILIIIFIIFPQPVTAAAWLVIPGLLLDMLILLSLSIFLSLANLRYRDMHLAVASAMQILPFVTPVFWKKDMLKDHAWIADANPLYHMIQILRAPLLGQKPEALSWLVTGGIAVMMLAIAITFFVRYRHRIIFWL